MPTRRLGRSGRRGQSVVEFSLIAPFLFLTIFGIVEIGLVMFDLASSRFAAAEAAKVVAQAGAQTQPCSTVPGCTKVFANRYTDCDADCQGISSINQTALGTTALEQVTEIDIVKLTSDGTFRPTGLVNQYKLDGTVNGSHNYPATSPSPDPRVIVGIAPISTDRDTHLNAADYVSVVIKFDYNWQTGLFRNMIGGPLHLSTQYFVRLEPQQF